MKQYGSEKESSARKCCIGASETKTYLSPSIIQHHREGLVKELSHTGKRKSPFPSMSLSRAMLISLRVFLWEIKAPRAEKIEPLQMENRKITKLLPFGREQTRCHRYPNSLFFTCCSSSSAVCWYSQSHPGRLSSACAGFSSCPGLLPTRDCWHGAVFFKGNN